MLKDFKSKLKVISSLQNDEIKRVAALKDKKGRDREGLFVVEGFRAIETFLKADWMPVKIFFTKVFFEKNIDNFKNFKIFERLETLDVLNLCTERVFCKISNQSTPSGCLAVFKIPKQKDFNVKSGLVMFNISDPGNMGTLIRTCVAFSSACVIVEGCDLWSPKVVQATAGNIAYVKIFEYSWEEFLKLKGGSPLVALIADGGERPSVTNMTDGFLVSGNEAHGLPDYVVEICDYKVTLPVLGPVESLNVAVAGSIALYLSFRWKK